MEYSPRCRRNYGVGLHHRRDSWNLEDIRSYQRLMRQITLARVTGETIGALLSDGLVCYTMELPWRDNRPNISCIPDGDYTVCYMARSSSGKYKDVYHVKGVKGRSGILIHKGNTASDTLGCILPGSRAGYIGGKRAVLGSAQAMRKLHKVVGRKSFTLKVRTLF